jgi:altronate dehydratase large subunit
MKFYGYPRPDGKVGARNYVAIIPTVGCVNPVVSKVVSTIRGTVAIRHDQVCLHPPKVIWSSLSGHQKSRLVNSLKITR